MADYRKGAWPAVLFGLLLFFAAPASAESGDPDSAAPGSLFDRLFGRVAGGELVHEVPFPFTALTDRIGAVLGGEAGPARVLIPLGRSLQRHAAEPDFFKHPRVILAVDRNPTGSGDKQRLILKDRLFLGYQEKAATIEVISYSETAGRFEFQVVEDYGPGLRPKVSAASRVLCLGCHQNGGPIWPEAPWDETNGNPQVVARLEAENPGDRFQGIAFDLTRQGADTAFRLAASIDRAALFAPHQALWRQGCGVDLRCRGALFLAALRTRLSGNRGAPPLSGTARETFEAGWRASWPGGLAIAEHRLPNRDPWSEAIVGAFDPLEPRPPRLRLEAADAGAVADVVAGLSAFLPDQDLRDLDRRLFEAGRDGGAARRDLTAACAFSKAELGGWGQQVRFSCSGEAFELAGQLYAEPGQASTGTVERLRIGATERFVKLGVTGPVLDVSKPAGELRLTLDQPIGRIHARLTGGSALESLTLRWQEMAEENPDPSGELRQPTVNGSGVLTILDDFAPVPLAVERLVRKAEAGEAAALSGPHFDGPALMTALFSELDGR